VPLALATGRHLDVPKVPIGDTPNTLPEHRILSTDSALDRMRSGGAEDAKTPRSRYEPVQRWTQPDNYQY
jgi:hypothetical protein